VHCWLQSNTNGGQLFLTIYDSIMTMVRQEDAQKTHEAVVRIMTDPSRLPGIPMVVDGKCGPTWATLEKIK
jgi:DNA polymerase I-like protein with 3'-5' exonuclease and polymerase domains